jgi:NAD(P)-dependent dehydrogenase (short-subunit alcohol dehydrogenase family)
MQLKDKIAIVYGAGGALGSAVALAFAKEGAKVFITGRTLKTLNIVANEINLAGGSAEATVVDALDAAAIDNHFKSVIEKVGHVDISINATGLKQTGIQGIPLVEITAAQLLHPITSYVQSNFLTAQAAGRHMVTTGNGVIIFLTAPPAKLAASNYGGMPAAWSAIESLNRTFAAELGTAGVRVVGIRANGMPETATIGDILNLHATGGITVNQVAGSLIGTTLLKRLPTLHQLASTAVFVASDNAGAITGTTLNLSVGAIAD